MARGSTDDLVIAPRFGATPPSPSVPVDAHIQNRARRMGGANRQQGMLGSFAKARILRRLAGAAAPRLLGAQASSAFSQFARLGVVGGTLAAIGVAAVKVVSDRTFEQLAEEFNDSLFGTFDDDARARRSAREALTADPTLSRVAYKNGPGELAPLFDALVEAESGRQRARSEIMRDKQFEAKGTLDMIFDGIEQIAVETWKSRQSDFEDFKGAIHRRAAKSPKWRAR